MCTSALKLATEPDDLDCMQSRIVHLTKRELVTDLISENKAPTHQLIPYYTSD